MPNNYTPSAASGWVSGASTILGGSSFYPSWATSVAKCDQGAADENCETAQSFCAVGKQKVNQNPGIDAKLTIPVKNETKVLDTLWNRIYTVLKNVQNYGARNGANNDEPRHPYASDTYKRVAETTTSIIPLSSINWSLYRDYLTQGYTLDYTCRQLIKEITNYRTEKVANGFKNVKKYDQLALSLYNEILDKISFNGTSGNPIITKALIDDLQNKINNYNLDYTRCNSCNTECNTACQAASQYSSGGGGGDCWEGSGGDCFCSQYDVYTPSTEHSGGCEQGVSTYYSCGSCEGSIM